ncbi:MAG TPA: helix-turn-helix domain-containing protein [Candidatus Faecousia intestinigallinarum]|nr:helix-turn-helix domain-containing protein [Candidatus Faecousia intestinigallinarum]
MNTFDFQNMTDDFPRPVSGQEQQNLIDMLQGKSTDYTAFHQKMEMTSRFVDIHYGSTEAPGGDGIPLHSHNFYEIIYCCNDCDLEYLVGSKHYHLQKGDIVIIAPGISHRPLFPENMAEPYTRYLLWISQEFMDFVTRLFTVPMPEISLLRTARTRWEFLKDVFARGLQESEDRNSQWYAALMGNSMYLLALLHRALQDESTSYLKAEKPDLLNRVLSYIESHLGDKISLKDTAQRFFVSQSTISQIFRKKMGISFYRCVTQRRLLAAKELIMQGMPLEAVNERVGFADYSTFYRAFRQEFGISPQQFRKLQVPPKDDSAS